MAEPVDMTVYVKSTKRRIRYQTATDDPMAYDVTETSADEAGPNDRVVKDYVELDNIRAELGLINLTAVVKAVNWAWRKLGMDTKPVSPSSNRHIEYRYDHPTHKKRGPF